MKTELDEIKNYIADTWKDIADTKEKLKEAEKSGDFTRRDRLEARRDRLEGILYEQQKEENFLLAAAGD